MQGWLKITGGGQAYSTGATFFLSSCLGTLEIFGRSVAIATAFEIAFDFQMTFACELARFVPVHQ